MNGNPGLCVKFDVLFEYLCEKLNMQNYFESLFIIVPTTYVIQVEFSPSITLMTRSASFHQFHISLSLC